MFKILHLLLIGLLFSAMKKQYHVVEASSHVVDTTFNVIIGGNADNNREHILVKLCGQFDSINILVRDRKIAQPASLKQLQQIMPQIKDEYLRQHGKDFQSSLLVFPLKGYTSNSIGGVAGNGYVSKGYSYFDGNKHSGHPAHDIFIRDKNQDCIDDKTNKYVPVLSVSDGVVVSTENTWDTASDLRGGKYIWIYEPVSNSLFYYAHNNRVLVTIGQMVKAGDNIAEVGRSGFNAYKKRSPTHLHFTQLVFDSGYFPRAVNPYAWLMKGLIH
jgi:murein DD-endopeptidase MepM/ murein hydrolase activator NlpD